MHTKIGKTQLTVSLLACVFQLTYPAYYQFYSSPPGSSVMQFTTRFLFPKNIIIRNSIMSERARTLWSPGTRWSPAGRGRQPTPLSAGHSWPFAGPEEYSQRQPFWCICSVGPTI